MSGEDDINEFFMELVVKLLRMDGSWQNLSLSNSPTVLTLVADLEVMETVPGFFNDLNLPPAEAREITRRLDKQLARFYWDARADVPDRAAAGLNLTDPQNLNRFHRKIDRLWTMLQEKRYISANEFARDYADFLPHQIPSSAAWWIEDSQGARWLVLAGLATLGRELPTVYVPPSGPPSTQWDPDAPNVGRAMDLRFRKVLYAGSYKAIDTFERQRDYAMADAERARIEDLLRRQKEDFRRVSSLLAPAGEPGSIRAAFLAQLEQDEADGHISSLRVRDIKRGIRLGEPLPVYNALQDYIDRIAFQSAPDIPLAYARLSPSAKMLWTYDQWLLIGDHAGNYRETASDVLRRYGFID